MQALSDGDKNFIKLTEAGTKPSAAFREAYPEHDAVRFWGITDPGTPERQKAAEVLRDAAKTKLQTKYIKSALMTYQDKMEQYSSASLDTAIDLVTNARSEKVRADLAIEGIRHKIGTPVQKVHVQEEKVVYLTFGDPPPETTPLPARDVSDIVEGETVERDQDETNGI